MDHLDFMVAMSAFLPEKALPGAVPLDGRRSAHRNYSQLSTLLFSCKEFSVTSLVTGKLLIVLVVFDVCEIGIGNVIDL